VLIDNNNEKELTNWVSKEYPEIKIVINSSPKGFSKNINDIINNNIFKYEYYGIVNPDLTFYPNVIDKQIECLDNYNDIGITGPKLLNTDGSVQYSCRRYPNLLISIGRFLQLDRFNKKLFSNYLMKDFNHKDNIDVDWLTGAMMIIRSKALSDIGLFDDKSFYLYCEDIDICKRMWINNWRVHYVSDSIASHVHMRKGVDVLSKNFYYQLKSTISYYKKYMFNNY